MENGGVPAWSDKDPYEYAWYSKQNPGNSANPGVLIFNPSGHNQPQVNTTGTQPLTARVYRIFDNRTQGMIETPDLLAPFYINLSVPFLKLGGDVLDTQNPLNNFSAGLNPYNGIYRDPLNVTPDVIIYNVNTGMEVGDWTNVPVLPPVQGTGKQLQIAQTQLPLIRRPEF